MAKKYCLKQISELNWQIPYEKSNMYLKESILLRIAEATELMAQNHKELVHDRDMYEEYWREEEERRAKLEKRIAGLKGYITRLKGKESSPDKGKLGKTKHTSDMIIDCARIIVNSTCPVKLIAAQIQYCRLVEKMYRQNARVK